MSRLLSALGQDAGKQHQVQYQTLFKWQRALVKDIFELFRQDLYHLTFLPF
jgi:hypothetical protein